LRAHGQVREPVPRAPRQDPGASAFSGAWRSAIFNNVVSVIDFRVETTMSSISTMTRPSARPTSEPSPASGRARNLDRIGRAVMIEFP